MWIAASATPARTSEARIAPIFVVMSWSALPVSPAWTEVSAPTKSIWGKRSSSLPAGAALAPTPVAVTNGPSEAGAAASPASGAAEAGRRLAADTTTTVSDRTSAMATMARSGFTSSPRAALLDRQLERFAFARKPRVKHAEPKYYGATATCEALGEDAALSARGRVLDAVNERR